MKRNRPARNFHTASRLVFLLFLAGLVTSCFPDRKLARSFVEAPPPIRIVLSPPAQLLKYNHKGEVIPGFDSLTTEQQDSALYWSSDLIREISDSLFLETYVNSFLDELRKLGFTVYLEGVTDEGLANQPQVYALKMAQLQLDEYYYPFDDEAEYFGQVYTKSFDLNAIDLSVWYELSKLKSTAPHTTVLYSTHSMTDGLDGRFLLEPFSTEVRYLYDIDSVRVADVMVMGTNLGKRHASYLYDFFMNQYVVFNLPKGTEPFWFYHYNRFQNKFEPVDEDRFQVLDND